MRSAIRYSAQRLCSGSLGAVVLSLGLAWGGSAQGPRFLRDTTFPGDPIQILLDRGAELKLTADQTSRLERLQQHLRAGNDSLVAKLVAIRRGVHATAQVRPRDMSPEQGATFRAAVERARPLMQAIGRNNYQAMQAVGAILTPAQKELVRTWLARVPGAGQGTPGMGRGRGYGGGRGAGVGGRVRGSR